MPLDSSIILSAAPPRTEPLNLLSNYAQLQQIQQNRIAMSAHQQALQMGALQQKAAELHLAEQQLSSQQQQEMLGIIAKNNGNMDASIPEGMARGLPQAQELLKQKGTADELFARTQKEQAEAAKATYAVKAKQRESAINSLSTLRKLSPELQPLYYQHLRMQALQADPNLAQQLPMTWSPEADQITGALQETLIGQKGREELALKQQAEAGKEKHWGAQEARAETAAQQLERYRQAQLQNQGARLAIDRQKLGIERGSQGSAITLTPKALDKAAKFYNETGAMQPMGAGPAANAVRSGIMNRAAELDETADLGSNKADYKANTASLGKLTGMLDAVTAFEGTATKNLDMFLGQARKVVDSGSPLLNKPLRAINEKALGSEDQAAFKAARIVAVTEIAKVLNNPNLTGQLSDSARHEVAAFSPENATLAQTYHIANILKQDMANRRTELSKQIGTVKGRMRGEKQTAPPEQISPEITSQLQKSLPAGAKIKSIKKVSD
jgi:hypothetical protein